MAVVGVTNNEWGLSLAEHGTLVQGIDDIRQCIQIICHTPRGTDPLRPLFACDVYQYLDKPINMVIGDIFREIAEALEMWEPRIENVKLSRSLSVDGSQLIVKIQYSIKNTVITDQMDVTYNLAA
jgi:phage baseplate assembly protein W